ncbi:MAG: amidohydrolase family protein [Deltaproteobacteria bacterium]|nr:amidohydrolase family protein [Deltaproteobacteria bacterium]
MSENIKIYDAHVHYLWRDSVTENCAAFAALREKGLQGMGLIIMGHHLPDPQQCFEFIPHSYHDRIGQQLFAGSSGMAVPEPGLFAGIEMFPYLDSRYITATEADLSGFREAGFRGLKLLYVPDEDELYGMVGWKKLFGRSQKDYEAVTLRMIEQAVNYGWPVIFHVDLRLHEAFVRHILQNYPEHPFIFPHFGFSRKIMARLIEQFDTCYTDFSSLLPFMQQAPEAYKNFITEYQTRVLFGSDATTDWPELVSDYIDTVKNLFDDQGILENIMQHNYLEIHQNRDLKQKG